jgi:anti-anti-sigma regulatory factor
MSDPSREFCLPQRCSLADLEALRTALRDHADQPVSLSARDWHRFDSLTLQFVMALQSDWRARGLRLRLTGVGADMAALLREIGLPSEFLTWEEAQ